MVMPMVVGLPRADGLSDDDGVLVPETHLICGIQIRMVLLKGMSREILPPRARCQHFFVLAFEPRQMFERTFDP